MSAASVDRHQLHFLALGAASAYVYCRVINPEPGRGALARQRRNQLSVSDAVKDCRFRR